MNAKKGLKGFIVERFTKKGDNWEWSVGVLNNKQSNIEFKNLGTIRNSDNSSLMRAESLHLDYFIKMHEIA